VGRLPTVKGDAHGCAGAPFSAHVKPPVSLPTNVNVASGAWDTAAGPDVIAVSGWLNALNATSSTKNRSLKVSASPVVNCSERIGGPPGGAAMSNGLPNALRFRSSRDDGRSGAPGRVGSDQ